MSETWNTITDIGTDLVARLEGFRADAYRDIAGIWTIGYGHKILPNEDFYPYGTVKTIGADDAAVLLASDMQKAANIIGQYVTVPLNERQFNALVSFVFNTASNNPSNFTSSHLLAKLNAGDYQGAAGEMNKWVYVHQNGQATVSSGLQARREAESRLFLS